MSKFLRDLLDAKEPMFSMALRQLEAASGKKSVDVKLTAEIRQKVRKKTVELGLDPDDTSGKELHHALIGKVAANNAHLVEKIGGRPEFTPDQMMPLIKAASDKVRFPRDCWVLKKSVAKKFIKETPPPNIMKIMGYKSVDSMLKQENIYEIYGALRFAESAEWLNAFNKHYDNITPSDFETRKIEIYIMPHARWADVADKFIHKKRHNITHLKELGVILMLPIKADKMPGITLWAFSLLFHYYNEIRLYSAFFKLQQVQSDFAKIFINTLIADPGDAAVMAGQKVHWRVIQRYFGKLEDEYHPEAFEPHVHPEDLHWRRAEEVLYDIAPELGFWKDLDYVGLMYGGRPLTLNLFDVAASYSNDSPYEKRAIYHFRESLWNEIFMRYMGQKTLERQILEQLDNDMIAPEALGEERPKKRARR